MNDLFKSATDALVYSCFLPQGSYETALVFVDDMLATPMVERNLYLRADLYGTKAWLLMLYGQYRTALESLETRNAILRNLFGGHQVSSEARLRAELGQIDFAREILKADKKAAEESGNPGQIHGVPLFAGYVAELANDPDFLQTTIEQLEMITNATDENRGILFYHFTMLARLYLRVGNPLLALNFSEQSMKILANQPNYRGREEDYFVHSRALRANGLDAEADEYLQKAYDRVMLVAGKTKDEALHQGWLENVRDNRDIVAEAHARGIR